MRERWYLAVAALAIVAGGAIGCSTGGSDADGDDAEVEQFEPAPDPLGGGEEATTSTTTDEANETTTSAPDDDATSTKTISPTACGGTEPGILFSSCDGPASVTWTIDGVPGQLDGGRCLSTDDTFLFQAGTATDDTYPGDHLDYAALDLPAETGSYELGVVTLVWNGQATVLVEASGERDESSGTFAGVTVDGVEIDGSFTC